MNRISHECFVFTLCVAIRREAISKRLDLHLGDFVPKTQYNVLYEVNIVGLNKIFNFVEILLKTLIFLQKYMLRDSLEKYCTIIFKLLK